MVPRASCTQGLWKTGSNWDLTFVTTLSIWCNSRLVFHRTICILWSDTCWQRVGLIWPPGYPSHNAHLPPLAEEKHFPGWVCLCAENNIFLRAEHVIRPRKYALWWLTLTAVPLVGPHRGIMSGLQHMVGLSPSICPLLWTTVGVLSKEDCSTGSRHSPNQQTSFMKQKKNSEKRRQ